MRHFRSTIHRGGFSLVIAAVLIAAISQLPAAKLSTGRQAQAADGSFISANVDGHLFTHTLSAGESAADARDALVALINADVDFMAESTTVPPGVFESDDVFFEVLTADGFELDSASACESDANYTNSGVHFPGGRDEARVRTPTSAAGDGVYDLRIDLALGPNAHLSIPTDVSDLVGTIISDLIALGFTVEILGGEIQITKPGDNILSVRVESTDTEITHTCATMRNPAPTTFPVMSHYAVVLLVVGLLLAGLVIIRRKLAAAG
jgi:hypothetical protein